MYLFLEIEEKKKKKKIAHTPVEQHMSVFTLKLDRVTPIVKALPLVTPLFCKIHVFVNSAIFFSLQNLETSGAIKIHIFTLRVKIKCIL